MIKIYCKFLLKRSRKLKIVFYCKNKKEYINTLDICKSCLEKEYKRNKAIRKRTTKQNKIEKERFSILTTDFTKCYICGKHKNDIHEIFSRLQ